MQNKKNTTNTRINIKYISEFVVIYKISINYQLSTINHQPLTINHQPSTVYRLVPIPFQKQSHLQKTNY